MVNLSAHDHLNAAAQTVLRQRNPASIQQIRRTIRSHLVCRAHGAGQDQRRIVAPQVIEKCRSLFEGIRALSNDHPRRTLLDLSICPVENAQ
ncbi:hypothetical protein D3C85_1368440 [compost metagenome]